MDYSVTYIRMCRKGQGDIKMFWKMNPHHDMWYNGFRVLPVASHPLAMTEQTEIFWMPRVEQLQDILMDDFPESSKTWQRWEILTNFFEFIDFKDADKDELKEDETFEQWWLLFFMHKKFKKTWDGKDWVEEALE